MKAIPQGGIVPNCNDIQHLRADKSMVGVIGTATWLQEISRIVRIRQPPPVWIVGRLAHSKPQCFGDSRDVKNDSIWAARREMQAPHDAMHRASMGATDGQRNWPNMRKTLGKLGFLSGEDRKANFWLFSLCFGVVRKVPKQMIRIVR
jgi:hypothetical protein